MASYTDITPKFNSYIAQQPVDAMVKVGMQKQEQYNEGVQKIQTSIDNVAGLDVASGLDKQYIQSKLNQLGNNLKTVAAGDFSNSQLVNSVGGMTKQISNDPNVINAVSSTSRIRQEQKNLEESEKAGKSSPQNRAKFEEGVSAYLNKTDIKQSYNDRYTQYTNVDKKLRDVADKIHESDTSYDNPFQRDSKGNTLYFDSKGNASLDPAKGTTRQDAAMLSVGSKAKSAQKILNTFYDTLTPEDINQLKIDGWYHYQGASKDTFKQEVISNYNKTKKIINDGVIDMALELQTNNKLTPSQKAQYQAQINVANKKLADGSLEKEKESSITELDNIIDIEGYKEKLYTQKTLTNLASDLAYDDKKLELKSSPYEQANDRRLQLNLAYRRSALEQNHWERTFARDNSQWQYEQTEKARIADAKSKRDTFSAIDSLPLSTDIDKPSLIKLGGKIDMMLGKRDSSGKIIIEGELDRLNSQAFSTIPGGDKMSNLQKENYLTKLSEKYSKNPGSISGIADNPGLRKYLESRRTLEVQIGIKQKLYNSTKELTKSLDKEQDNILKEEPGVSYSSGKQMYSAKELYSFGKNIENNYYSISRGVIPTTGMVDSNKLLSKLWEESKGKKEEPFVQAYIDRYLGKKLTYNQQVLLNKFQSIKQKYDTRLYEINDKKLKIESDYLEKNSPERQTQVGTFNLGVKETKDRILGFIGNELVNQNLMGASDTNKKSDADIETIKTMLKTPGTIYSMVKKSDGSADMILEGKGEKQTIPITTDKVGRHFPEIAKTNPLNSAKYAIQNSSDHSTNLFNGSGEGGAVTSMFSGFDLPQLAQSKIASRVRFDIEGDPSNGGSNEDGYTLKMYVQPQGSNIWIPGYLNQNFVPLSGIQATINNISDNTIDTFLAKHK